VIVAAVEREHIEGLVDLAEMTSPGDLGVTLIARKVGWKIDVSLLVADVDERYAPPLPRSAVNLIDPYRLFGFPVVSRECITVERAER